LEVLKQIAPSVKWVAGLRDPSTPSGTGQFAAIQAIATLLGVEINPVNLRDIGEIERAIAARQADIEQSGQSPAVWGANASRSPL
jgi:putative tryptophan/tyrosine transport system substrate-binding protein